MSATRAEVLTEIGDLTDRVQAAINDGDWREAGELEQRRRALLEALVADARSSGGRDVESILRSMNEDVNRLIGQVHHHQRRIAREATTIRTGREATREYTATAEAR